MHPADKHPRNQEVASVDHDALHKSCSLGLGLGIVGIGYRLLGVLLLVLFLVAARLATGR